MIGPVEHWASPRETYLDNLKVVLVAPFAAFVLTWPLLVRWMEESAGPPQVRSGSSARSWSSRAPMPPRMTGMK